MSVQEFGAQEDAMFAGAEDFPCGGKPLVDASDEKLLFIGSRYGINVYINDEFGEAKPIYYGVKFSTQAGCKLFMEFLPADVEELKKLGFADSSLIQGIFNNDTKTND